MAEGILSSVSMLTPDLTQIASAQLWPEDNPDEFQQKLESKIREVDSGDGVFILADMLGGTPCNRAVYSVGEKVRLLAGLSLPMLFSLLSMRDEYSDLEALATDVMEEASYGTVDVNKLLKEKGE